jgi:hypothetical protein
MPSPSEPREAEANTLVPRAAAQPLNFRINPDLAAAFIAQCEKERITQRAAAHEALCCWLSERNALPDGYQW